MVRKMQQEYGVALVANSMPWPASGETPSVRLLEPNALAHARSSGAHPPLLWFSVLLQPMVIDAHSAMPNGSCESASRPLVPADTSQSATTASPHPAVQPPFPSGCGDIDRWQCEACCESSHARCWLQVSIQGIGLQGGANQMANLLDGDFAVQVVLVLVCRVCDVCVNPHGRLCSRRFSCASKSSLSSMRRSLRSASRATHQSL